MKTEIHPKFLEYPELVEARERAENAIIAFDKLGDVRCTNRGYGPWHLCVNVKVRRYPLNGPPEIKEDMHERWYDMQAEDFWNLDFDGDCIAPDNCPIEFPKFFSEGRSGGYFVFDGQDSKRGGPAFSTYKQQSNFYGGTQEPRPEGTIDLALSSFDDVVDPFSWVTEERDFDGDEEKEKAWVQEDVDAVTGAFVEMAEVFESATMWAETVKGIMDYRLDCYEGKDQYAMTSLSEGEMFDFFDFTAVHVEILGDKATVSWPQHKRVWNDVGEWEECGEKETGAQAWGQGVFRKFVQKEATAFEIEMDRDQLIECLNEDLADAVSAIRKRALKS